MTEPVSGVRPKLPTMISCALGYGKLTATSCVKRYKVATGIDSAKRAKIDDDSAAQLKASRCNGCPHGAARARGDAVQVEAPPAPRFDAAHVARPPPLPTKPCEFCGTPFEHHKPRQRHCTEKCRSSASHARKREAAQARPPRFCAGGCGKSVQTAKGQQRWCHDPCKPHKYAKPPVAAQRDATRRSA